MLYAVAVNLRIVHQGIVAFKKLLKSYFYLFQPRLQLWLKQLIRQMMIVLKVLLLI